MARVTHIEVVGDSTLYVRFSDGSEGRVDLANELDGPIFEPLKDPEFFARATLSPGTHTVV